MKNVIKRFIALFGIITVSTVMILAFASCGSEPDDSYSGPEIPSYLIDTSWYIQK